MEPLPNFKATVYEIMGRVPYGKITTYGDVAALAGHPTAARVIGQIAHFGPEELPWQRLVNRNGVMARGFWGGPEVHRKLLSEEGVEIDDQFRIVDMEKYRWYPI